MSGGYFDYKNRQIIDFAESIEREIKRSGKKKTKKELEDDFRDKDWYKEYPEDLYHHEYPKEVIKEFKNAVKYLKLSHIYANRIDYLLSGDDGEESFLKRLKEELNVTKKE